MTDDKGHRWVQETYARVRCRRCRTVAVLTRNGFMRVQERSPWDYADLGTCEEETARKVLES